MARPSDGTLEDLLRQVSRSFYLSIHVLPAAVRQQIGLSYLLARAADTIADTEVVPAGRRLDLLRRLRQAVLAPSAGAELLAELGPVLGPAGAKDAERRLLLRLPECLSQMERLGDRDRGLIEGVLDKLVTGMERDLKRFPAGDRGIAPERVVALETLSDLDEYTYYAAGCVGEFWTELCAAHLPALGHLRGADLLRRGVCLGKALQMVNVIRDAPADLRAGRCYWPAEVLGPLALTPEVLAGLVQPGAAPPGAEVRAAVLAATGQLLGLARGLCDTAWPYVQALPPGALRLRLSCSWPLLLGLDTLALIEEIGSPVLQPQRVAKVQRRQVYGMVARTAAAALWDGLRRRDRGALDRIEQEKAHHRGAVN